MRGKWPWLAAGLVTVSVAAVVINQSASGVATSYGGERHGFYSYTGFPDVDFPTTEWDRVVGGWGNAAWLGTEQIVGNTLRRPHLVAQNLWYAFAGQHVGILPYFLPTLLLLAAPFRRRATWIAWLVLGAGLFALTLVRPFNFYGGGAAIANRYFLPLYPAAWFAQRDKAKLWPALVAALLAAPFLLPLWSAPSGYPYRENGTYRYVSSTARRLLPYETTQSHLKPAGREDVRRNGLWIKFLDPTVSADAEDDRLWVEPNRPSALLVGTPQPTRELSLRVFGPGALGVTVRGAQLTESEQVAGWERRATLVLRRPTARHPMWWTWEDYYLYRLELTVSGPADNAVPFSLAR